MLDFVVIGARKAGTSWLYDRLRSHPEIHFPREKEMSFWSVHYPLSLRDATHTKNLDWYSALFNHKPSKGNSASPQALYTPTRFDRFMRFLDTMGGKPASKEQRGEAALKTLHAHRLGDFSPTYCYFDDPSTLPAIRAYAPDLRVIYLLRNPMARAWSAAEKLRKVAGLSPQEVSDQWYIDHFRSQQSLRHGNYVRAITAWREAFPEERLLLLRFEDIPQDPHAFLKACCAHIGVQEADYFDAVPFRSLVRLPFSDIDEPIRESLLPPLHGLYDEIIEKLYSLTGIDYRGK